MALFETSAETYRQQTANRKQTQLQNEEMRRKLPFVGQREQATIDYTKSLADINRFNIRKGQELLPYEKRIQEVAAKEAEQKYLEFMQNEDVRRAQNDLKRITAEAGLDIYNEDPERWGRLTTAAMQINAAKADAATEAMRLSRAQQSLDELYYMVNSNDGRITPDIQEYYQSIREDIPLRSEVPEILDETSYSRLMAQRNSLPEMRQFYQKLAIEKEKAATIANLYRPLREGRATETHELDVRQDATGIISETLANTFGQYGFKITSSGEPILEGDLANQFQDLQTAGEYFWQTARDIGKGLDPRFIANQLQKDWTVEEIDPDVGLRGTVLNPIDSIVNKRALVPTSNKEQEIEALEQYVGEQVMKGIDPQDAVDQWVDNRLMEYINIMSTDYRSPYIQNLTDLPVEGTPAPVPTTTK